MATSILLDKVIRENGHDDWVDVHVRLTYASASDTVIIESGKDSLYLGVNEAQEFAIALAKFVKYYSSHEVEEELKKVFEK